MNTTTLPKQAGELASHVGDTMTDAVSKGMERARDLVTTAEEHLPDTAVDWTREHVPGLGTRSPSHTRRNLFAIVFFVTALAALTWWMRRRSANSVADHLGDDVSSKSGSGSPGWRAA
jgi:hypothetical protein